MNEDPQTFVGAIRELSDAVHAILTVICEAFLTVVSKVPGTSKLTDPYKKR